jgi:hypothetical protein
MGMRKDYRINFMWGEVEITVAFVGFFPATLVQATLQKQIMPIYLQQMLRTRNRSSCSMKMDPHFLSPQGTSVIQTLSEDKIFLPHIFQSATEPIEGYSLPHPEMLDYVQPGYKADPLVERRQMEPPFSGLSFFATSVGFPFG